MKPYFYSFLTTNYLGSYYFMKKYLDHIPLPPLLISSAPTSSHALN
jgi:hypothetical protein